MKLIIDKNRKVYSAGTWGTKNENNYEILDFEFPEELEEYNKRIVYYLGNQKVWDPIIDNKAILTNAITTKGSVKAYIWCTKTDAQYETDVDFRTQLFEMNFFENDNADGIVPTPEQVDGFNTMLTAMNEKIEEIDELETTIKNAETQRQENEETRQNNEKTRQENEQTRQSQEADRERRTDKAIADIEDKTAEYNANAEEKTNDFNQNATQKTNDFNLNYTQKVNDFNTNATTQKTDFNTNASSKTSAFNSNAEAKTNAFNTNATNKTNAFNSNATGKTTEFNTNAESKTNTFNDNATQKTTNFDNNASEKTDEFNTNAQNKIDEYDEHIVEYQAQIDELQEEVDELSENMPWNTTEQSTEISVDDAAKYSRNKLELFGNTEQESTSISGGDEYDSPSPDHPQPIHVVTGENTIEVQGKNLFPSNLVRTDKDWLKVNSDGSISIKYDSGGNINFTNLFSEYLTNIPIGNYRLKIFVEGIFKGGNLIILNTAHGAIAQKAIANNNVFTIQNSDIGNMHLYVVSAGTDCTIKFELEEGTTEPTEYQKYYHADYLVNLGNIELCKIGNYQDYLYKENGNWYKYEKILKADGNRDWYLGSSNPYQGIYQIQFNNTNALFIQDSNARVKSNMYMGVRWGDSWAKDNAITVGKNIVRIMTSNYTSINDFKEFLSNNNFVAYYVINVVTPVQITDETLIDQLDAIYEHLKLVKGTNHITITPSDLEPYVTLNYMQDLPSKLDNLDSRLSLLE